MPITRLLFIELEDDKVFIHADAPIEAPTVRGFVSILVEGLSGATVEEILSVKNDLIDRIGLAEILGMLRVRGLSGVLTAPERSDEGGDRQGSGVAEAFLTRPRSRSKLP